MSSSSESGSESSSSSSRASSPASNASSNRSVSPPPVRQPPPPKPSARRRRDSDDSDNRQYFDDAREYEEWKGKSEKEREQIIFQKMEQKEQMASRELARKTLAERQRQNNGRPKRRGLASDSDNSDTEFLRSLREPSPDVSYHQPSEVDRKKKQSQAMSDLMKKRKVKEAKDAAKQSALNIDDVFGKDDSDDGSSSSSSSSPSSRSSSPASSRDSSPARQSPAIAEERKVDSLEELSRARLSRYHIARFIHYPFLKDFVVGSYVKVQTRGGRYQIGRVVDLVESSRTYDIEVEDSNSKKTTKTNRRLKIKYGHNSEDDFPAIYISNQEFSQEEFAEWRAICSSNDSLPTVEQCQKKGKQLDDRKRSRIEDKDINEKLKEQARHNTIKRPFAVQKEDLMKQKQAAENSGDYAKAQEIQLQIEDLDNRADYLNRKRAGNTVAIDWINMKNKNKMKEQFLGDRITFEDTSGDDPFTRKKERMKVVSGRPAGAAKESSPSTTTTLALKRTATPEVSASERLPKRAVTISERYASLQGDKIQLDFSRIDRHSEMIPRPEPAVPSVSAPIDEPPKRQITLERYKEILQQRKTGSR